MKYSKQIKELAINHFRKGQPIKSIASVMGIPFKTVERWVDKGGVTADLKLHSLQPTATVKSKIPSDNVTLEYKISKQNIAKMVEKGGSQAAGRDHQQSLEYRATGQHPQAQILDKIEFLEGRIEILKKEIDRLDIIKINKPFAKVL